MIRVIGIIIRGGAVVGGNPDIDAGRHSVNIEKCLVITLRQIPPQLIGHRHRLGGTGLYADFLNLKVSESASKGKD